MRARMLVPLLALAALAPAAQGATAWKYSAAGNVRWSFVDSVAACPAADSLLAGHPARLRVGVVYTGASPGVPRAGVPPESLLLSLAPVSGTVAVNDLESAGGRALLFADDSTGGAGETRFTVPSFSGSGRMEFRIVISGDEVGADTVAVRSVDTDLDGRVTEADPVGDLDYSGAADAADQALRDRHLDHWHRTVLFGTPVRRTDLCGPCPPASSGTLGESGASWSPDGRFLAFTSFTGPTADCAVFLARSDPAEGNALVQITFPPAGVHDYDPDWSPLGTEVVFDRGDSACYRKGVPGIAPDTSLHLVTRFDDGTPLHRGDITPVISPDGRWVAFSRKSPEGYWHLWKIPIEGMEAGAAAIQLTSTLYASDMYPRWTPDGEWIYYDRQNGFDGARRVYRVRASGGPADSLLAPGGGLEATTPGLAPDGRVALAGVGTHFTAAAWAVETALPAQTTLDRAIPAFPDYGLNEDFPLLSPRYSPDGTRVALRAPPPDHPAESPQIWATRRNMSRPPAILTVAGQPIAPATPVVDIPATPGSALSFAIAGSDPEDDPLAWSAFFLRPDLGMSFDATSAVFAWTPPAASADSTFTVRFQVTTPSGGTAYALARIHVSGTAGLDRDGARGFALHSAEPNPCAGPATVRFDLPAGAQVQLEVLDLQGRRVATLVDRWLPAGRHAATWAPSRRTRAGIYLCRLTAGPLHAQRKLVLVP